MMTVAITGASGFVAESFMKKFEGSYRFIKIKREYLKAPEKLKEIIEESDVVINLAGATILSRWSPAYKDLLYSSRIETTKALVEAMASAEKRPKLLISASAVGIYKNGVCCSEKDEVYEDDFLSILCQNWEKEALNAKELGVKVAITRFGVIYGKGGGAFLKMELPFRLGVGGKIGDGTQKASFIHIKDLTNAFEHIIQNDLEGTFNFTSPKTPTNLEMTKALGRHLKRPTFFTVPAFMVKLLFGEGSRVILDSKEAYPENLLKSGFRFSYGNIDDTVKDLIS